MKWQDQKRDKNKILGQGTLKQSVTQLQKILISFHFNLNNILNFSSDYIIPNALFADN